MAIPSTGDLAPLFETRALDGEPRALRVALEGGPVLVCFFKLGCGACELTLPLVEALWAHYREHQPPEGSRLSVWGVSQDEAAGTAELRDAQALSFPLFTDAAGLEVSRAYGLEATPSLILLAGREKLQRGAAELPEEEARRVLATMEGFERKAFEEIDGELAARLGALPADVVGAEVPDFRPG